MILHLIREQLRSHWRFTAWTAGLLPLILHITSAALSPQSLVNSLHWNATVAGYSLVSTTIIVATALGIALGGALIVAFASRSRTPVEALRPSRKAHAQ